MWGCQFESKPPPGYTQPKTIALTLEGAPAPGTERAPLQVGEGGRDDNLPFDATGAQLASIAWRTWVYTDVGPHRTRYGYLRAGQIVDRREPAIHNAGCEQGWYRINPRGFVCVGRGATLDLTHPVVAASARRPRRGEGLPYPYVLTGDHPPHFYVRVPEQREMRRVEGDFAGRANRWWSARVAREEEPLLELMTELPSALQLPALVKPYGVTRRLQVGANAGRASRGGGLALLGSLRRAGRTFGLATELDWVPLDRTELVVPSTFHGLVLEEGSDLPVGITSLPWTTQYQRDEHTGALHAAGSLPRRTVVDLSGEVLRYGGARFFHTREGHYLPAAGLHLVAPRSQFPSVATGGRKWIDVSINSQVLVAYEGRRAVFVTLISSGAGGLGDPEEVPATVQGTFMIHAKHVSVTMNGDDDKSDSYNLSDVPFVQYFHRGYALHAAYWHDDFGRARSHGCINLSPRDSAWLFEWTDPHVPETWHGVLNQERGTVVHIRP